MALSAESVLAAFPSALRKPIDRIRSSSAGGRLAHGVIWSVVGAFGSRGLTLISYVIVARLLGTAGFGEFSAVQTTVGTILVIAGLGLGMTATKYVAELRYTDPGSAARMIALCQGAGLIAGVGIALAIIALASVLSRSVLADPHLITPLRISALIILFSTLASIQSQALAGFEAFDTLARINLAVAPIGLVATALGAYVWGVSGSILGLAFLQGLTWLFNRRELVRRLPLLRTVRWVWPTPSEWEALYQYSAPVLLVSLVIAFTNWAAVAALVNQPGGYPEMGVFGAANQWLVALMVLPTIIGQVVFPHATLVIKEGYAASSRLVRHATAVTAAVSLPIVIIGCAFSPFIMKAYGAGFGGSALTLVVVLVTAGLLAVQTPAVQIVAASGRMWVLLLTYLVWSAIFIGGALYGVRWGAIGLAGARLLAYAIHTIAIYVTARMTLLRNDAQPALDP
jgi:O-antigen/teichoic acid export membrane protein